MKKYALKYQHHKFCYIENNKLLIETEISTKPTITVPLSAIESLKESQEDEYKILMESNFNIDYLSFENITERKAFLLEVFQSQKFKLKDKKNLFFTYYLSTVYFFIAIIFLLNFGVFILRTTGIWTVKSNLVAVQISNNIADALGVWGSCIGFVLVIVLSMYASYKNWNKSIPTILILTNVKK